MEGESHLDHLKLISGGQTGIDRAALDFCLEHGLPCGGWCPAGRRAEDGTIPLRYPLKESPEPSYKERTAANVHASDATVIIYSKEMEGGTLKSFEFARKGGKPFLLLDMSVLDVKKAADKFRRFLNRFQPGILNFSGPRLSDWEEGYSLCYSILESAFGDKVKTPSAGADGVGIPS